MKEENLVMTLIETLKAQIKRQFIILLIESTIIETAIKLNMSERSVNRRRKSIINKIKRVI